MERKLLYDVLHCEMRDKLTGFQGVATSVCINGDGTAEYLIEGKKKKASHWIDSKRLEIVSSESGGGLPPEPPPDPPPTNN